MLSSPGGVTLRGMKAHHFKGYAAELAVAALLTTHGIPVAMPIGPTDWDVVARAASGRWITIQVKAVQREQRGAKVVDCRKRTPGDYTDVDFLVAYDVETHDYWVFRTQDLQRQITLTPALLGYRNLEIINDAACALQGRCLAGGPGPH